MNNPNAERNPFQISAVDPHINVRRKSVYERAASSPPTVNHLAIESMRDGDAYAREGALHCPRLAEECYLNALAFILCASQPANHRVLNACLRRLSEWNATRCRSARGFRCREFLQKSRDKSHFYQCAQCYQQVRILDEQKRYLSKIRDVIESSKGKAIS